MARGMNTAREGKTVPVVQSIRYATGQVFKRGAVLVENAAGECIEASADPQVGILGIALQGAGTGLGFDLANSSITTVVTGRGQEVSVAKADRATIFSARAVNGGTDPVLPLQTHVGEAYSILKVGDDWVIDMAAPTTPTIEIVDIVESEGGGNTGFFLFKFMESVLAHP